MSTIIFQKLNNSFHKCNIENVKRLIVDKKRETIGEYVKRVRVLKELSLAEVQRRSGNGIAGSYINRIENGYITNPTPAKLRALALGLGVDPQELFDIAQGERQKDSDAYKDSDFAVMHFKYEGIPKNSKKKAEIDVIKKLLDEKLDAALEE
jgi:transcriptional regulator with XRE-family HTH domain